MVERVVERVRLRSGGQGRVEAVGTYDELVAKGVDLSRTTADEDADGDADDEEARGRADTTRSDAESLVPSGPRHFSHQVLPSFT